MTLLDKYKAPERLRRHLVIVHSTASQLVAAIRLEWPELVFSAKDVLFGAASHDIGKVKVNSELYEDGKIHLEAGVRLLQDEGYPDELARFAGNHENWQEGQLPLEDLLVSLADICWAGKRVYELEEMIVNKIADKMKTDYWEVYPVLDRIVSGISENPDEIINWQNGE